MIRDDVSGGYVAQTEYLIAKYASESKFSRRSSNKLIALATRVDFNPIEICTDSIRQIERWIALANDLNVCIRWTSGIDPVFEGPYCDCCGLGGRFAI